MFLWQACEIPSRTIMKLLSIALPYLLAHNFGVVAGLVFLVCLAAILRGLLGFEFRATLKVTSRPLQVKAASVKSLNRR